MSILNILLLLSILTLSPLTHALEEALGTPTTVTTSPIVVPIAQADPATLLEAALQLREAKPALFAGAQGVLIVKVVPGSQAAEKGLQPGDIVIAYAGEKMNSVDQLIEAIQAKASQSQVVLRVIRGEKVEEVGLRGGKMGVELREITEKNIFTTPLTISPIKSDLVMRLPQTPPLIKADSKETMLKTMNHLNKDAAQAYNMSDYDAALEKWTQGLELAYQAESYQAIAGFLGNIGLVYDVRGEYQKAIDYYQQALTINRKLHYKHGEGKNLNNVGVAYDNLGEYQKALEYYQQSLAVKRELGDKQGEGDNLTNIGGVYGSLGNYSTALEYHYKSLVIHREFNDKNGESADLGNIGLMYANLGEYSKALDYYQQALTINRQLGYKQSESVELNSIGNVHANLGDYQKALDYHQRALLLRRVIGDNRGEAESLNNIGAVYTSLGKYSQAIENYQQSLSIVGRIGDQSGESAVLGNLGNIYVYLNHYQQASNYYQQALTINLKIGNKRGQGADLSSIAMVSYYLGDYPTALSHYQQSLAIKREIKDKQGEGTDFNNLGVIYREIGQYQNSLNNYQRALDINSELGDNFGQGSNLANLGVLYTTLNQYQEAHSAFQKSIFILEKIGNSGLWIAQRGLAFVETHLNQINFAINHYEQALSNIEKLRTRLPETQPLVELKSQFMQDKLFVYDEFITLLQTEHPKHPDQGYDRKAIETFERKQGRVFLEQMGKSTARRFAGIPEDISIKDRDLENQVAAARKNLSDAYAKGKDIDPSPFRQHLEEVEKAQQAFEKKLITEYPKYYALKYPKPVALNDLQQNVLQNGELLLIYNVREEATDLWLVGKQHFQMFSLPMTEAQVKEQVEAFRKWGIDNAITDENSLALEKSLEKYFTDFTQASQALYQQLFPATVRTLLGEAQPKRLYIVPTSALYELPFEALVTENTDKPHYLLQDYAISYLSSASLLKTLRDAKQRRGTAQRQPLLAFADPVYPPCSDTTQTTSTEETVRDIQTKGYLKVMSTDCFKPLPVSGQEARAIAELLEVEEDNQPLPLQLGEDAAKSTVLQFNDKQWLDDYRYILFSTHAILPNEVSYVQQSAIVLSHQQASEDGFLTMGDVFGLSMNTDLVMLSACNTGRGETIKGEGTIGLIRAFMYAGTPAVSITLWSIEAWAAQKLNVAWFTRLKAGQPLADSLREAKLEMLDKSGYYRYPYAWAGVVVFGDGK